MLDLFFRKYAWTANLALLVAAALLSAKTVNTLVGAAIRPRPEVDLAAGANAPPPRPPVPVALENDRLFHLIGVEPPKIEETAAAPANVRPQTCQDPRATPVKSDLRLGFVAGTVAEKPEWSLATLTDPTTRETRLVGVGEQFAGVTLLGLERMREGNDATGNAFRVVAVICNGGTKEYVDFDGTAAGGAAVATAESIGTAAVPPPRAAPRPGAPGTPLEGVRSTGPNQYEIDQAVVDSTLSNLNTIATQARIVPSFQNGQANGFKLFSIQPGSLYASLGIENGDVIQRINGYEINSPEKALEIYSKLRESSVVTMDVLRGNQPVQKQVTIKR
jgi:general secretion pathway protein C